jgi:hypothetical protein
MRKFSGVQAVSGPVVIGVQKWSAARHAVLWAAAEARIRRCDLIITHLDPPAGDPVNGDSTVVKASVLLDELAAVASEQEPSVIVGTLVLREPIGAELVRLTRSATLLVLGFDKAAPRADSGVVSLADHVRGEAQCDVIVFDADAALRHVPE